jgi:hypothetical protein
VPPDTGGEPDVVGATDAGAVEALGVPADADVEPGAAVDAAAVVADEAAAVLAAGDVVDDLSLLPQAATSTRPATVSAARRRRCRPVGVFT